MSLGFRVAVRAVVVFALAAGVVFLPAGTWRYWQGWAWLAACFLPSILAFVYFLRHDRELVERRLRTREKVAEQKRLIQWMKPLFLVAFLLPGFDFRFGWSRNLLGAAPMWLSLLSTVLVAAAFVFIFWVLKTNSYAWVRHPMYTGCVVLLLFTPLALGSWLALPVFALLVPFYGIRLRNHEKVLRAELSEYSDYCTRTRYRLIPFVW